MNQNPKCEPQLGRRGIYRPIGGDSRAPINDMAVLWVLNLSDGTRSLLDIAEKSGLDFKLLQQTVDVLIRYGLLKENNRNLDA
jgi:aminopeptidase-like protein